MTAVATPSVSTLWDPEGRRVPGGAIAPDPPALEGDDELTFSDFLSIINPLQHIPGISTLYRWITGDTIKPAPRVIGGALFGGPIGLVTAGFNAIVEQATGKDAGGHVLALLQSDTPSADAPIAQKPPEEAQPSTPPLALTPKPGTARSLAFYQANAGNRLAPIETGRDKPLSNPVDPTGRAIPSPLLLMKATGATQSAPAEGAPSEWFTATMLRGLDQYRSMQRLDQAPSQLDMSY